MIERDHLVLVKHAPLVEDLKQYGSQSVQGYYRNPNTPFNIPQSFPPTPPKGQVCGARTWSRRMSGRQIMALFSQSSFLFYRKK